MEIPWGALVALFIYIIGSTLGFVWWMATQTVKLEVALTSLEKITASLHASEAVYATKVELAKELAVLAKSVDKSWAEIDKLRDK